MGAAVAVALAALGATAGAPGPAAAAPGDPYVVLGDSVSYGMSSTSPNESFVGRLYADFQTTRGAGLLSNHAVPGATAGGGRNGQLTAALNDINAQSDTVAVTAGFGGNEALGGSCLGKWDQSACPLRENLDYILSELKTALAADPGTEFFAVLAYYNPRVGTEQEAYYDEILHGANMAPECADTGADVGLNDVIFQEAGDHEAAVAITYPPMKLAGPAAIAGDGIHPNNEGHAVIAQAFKDAVPVCPATPDGGPGPPPPPPSPTARCAGFKATIVAAAGETTVGTAGRDVIAGTAGRDRIQSGGGSDLVCARGGNDEVIGGAGADLLLGGAGADVLKGKAGPDVLLGQAGADRLFGGPGKDRLLGGAGPDKLFGGPGLDRLLGGPGKNRLVP